MRRPSPAPPLPPGPHQADPGRCSENALWDIVGKVCGQPLHKLWGAYRESMQVYLTTVWPVDHYQDEVTPAQQAADLLELNRRGGCKLSPTLPP